MKKHLSRPLDNPPLMSPPTNSIDGEDEIIDESDMVTPRGSPTSKRLVCDGSVSTSPTISRSLSSISMSQVPALMSAGQYLPSEEVGGLGAAMQALQRREMEQANDGFSNSDPEDSAPLFPYELGQSSASTLVTIRPHLPRSAQRGSYPKAMRSGKLKAQDILGHDSGDEDATASTAAPAAGDGAPIIRDFADEKDENHLSPESFPEYDDEIAMALLSQPEQPLLMPIRRCSRDEEEWTIVDNDDQKWKDEPIGSAEVRARIEKKLAARRAQLRAESVKAGWI